MIAQVKTSPDQSVAGYLALTQSDDGEWFPLSDIIYSSADAAMRACRSAADRTLETACDCLDRARANLARISDRPLPTDRVRIRGRLCIPEGDGTLTLTFDDKSKAPLPVPDITIDDALYQAIFDALNLTSLSRSSGLHLVVDILRDQPVDFLAALEATRPDMLLLGARLLVELAALDREAERER